MADADFTLPRELASEVEAMDCFSQYNNEIIDGLAKAIKKLTNDPTIISLAKHISYLADDTTNQVNAVAEKLGANFRESDPGVSS